MAQLLTTPLLNTTESDLIVKLFVVKLLLLVSGPRKPIQPIETPKPTFTQPTFDAREKYANILGETAMSFTSRDVNQFNPAAVGDPVNGNLGNGELGMDQIMNLLNGK